MLKYAQADTHYLLYVYDRVRADLYDMGNGQPALIQQVWAKSRDLSLKVCARFFIPNTSFHIVCAFDHLNRLKEPVQNSDSLFDMNVFPTSRLSL